MYNVAIEEKRYVERMYSISLKAVKNINIRNSHVKDIFIKVV
jgi:hypothetical protein